MIVKEDFLNKLRQFFGLNLYEVRIWTALLSRGVSTAGELSDIGDVPRSRAYDVLESLEKKGFVVMKVGKPIKYLAVEPKEVVERVKRTIKDDAERDIAKLKELNTSDVLGELGSLFKNGVEFVEPADLSGAIRGRHNIYAHLETMVKKANKSITLVTTSKGVLRKVDALSPSLTKLSKKGVKIRVVAPKSEENKQTLNDIGKMAEVKELKGIDARFCIVDGNEIMFMMMHDDEVHPSYDIGIWVNTPYFAGAMENLLNASWKKS
jgi:HTH-type transcriptional regulator, sugar sensing transcriptional regulator